MVIHRSYIAYFDIQYWTNVVVKGKFGVPHVISCKVSCVFVSEKVVGWTNLAKCTTIGSVVRRCRLLIIGSIDNLNWLFRWDSTGTHFSAHHKTVLISYLEYLEITPKRCFISIGNSRIVQLINREKTND